MSAASPPCFVISSYNKTLQRRPTRWLQFPNRRNNDDHHHNNKLFSSDHPRKSKSKGVNNRIVNASTKNSHTYTFKTTTDIPFYEAPQASFDEYLEEKSRVVKAICPHEMRKPEQITEEEWRIHMAPIEFMFVSASPVVHMRVRCKTKGVGYPNGIPTNTSKLLELKVIKSELKGEMDELMKQTEFHLGVEGVVYPQRRKGLRSRIKGYLLMSITYIPPPALSLLPQHLHSHTAQLILRTIGERMEKNVSDGLLADYGKFKREKR